MATTATLGGLSLTTGNYTISEGIDFGGNDLAATLLTGDLRPDEFDQYLAELRYVRQFTLPVNLRSGTFAQSITDAQAIIQKLSAASRYTPVDFVFTPNGGNASTFKVIGGALQLLGMNQQVNLGLVRDATLTLQCLPFVYGAAQTFGSSGSPLVSNTASPANMPLTLSPTGDVPADVTLFVRNQSSVANLVQTITVNATGGTWQIAYQGNTSPVAFGLAATGATIQPNVQALPGCSGVLVTGSAGGPYTATFPGGNPSLFTADATNLTGGSHSVTIVGVPTGVAIRSLLVSCVSGNTTWTAKVDQSTWTLDTYGVRPGGGVTSTTNTVTTGAVSSVAHFTAPTLPTDRRIRLYLRTGQGLNSTADAIKFRVRLSSGSSEIVGGWRALPQQFNSTSTPYAPALADMGAFTFPVSEVGQLGGQSTTVYVEVMDLAANPLNAALHFYDALFLPDDNTLLAETSDTSKTLAAAAGVTRVETDQVYDSSGNPAGGATIGSHIRSLGGRYVVYTSQGYAGSLDTTLPYAPENVDLWATAVPRFLHLA